MTTFESLGTPPPSYQMESAQEETWCIVNTPSLNFNFRLFTHHFPQGFQYTHASTMSHICCIKKYAHLSKWEIQQQSLEIRDIPRNTHVFAFQHVPHNTCFLILLCSLG